MTQDDPTELRSEDAEMLRSVVTGDLDADAPEVRARLDAAPELRARLAQLRAVSQVLDAAASEESETLREARRMPRAPGDDRAAETLRRVQGELQRVPDASPGLPRSAWIALVAAAAAILLVGRFWLGSGDSSEQGPVTLLGSDGLELLVPVGQDQSFEEFRWRSVFPPDSTYHVRVFDAAPGPGSAWSHSSEPLSSTSWTPPAGLDWPERIRWEVEAIDSAGGYLGATSAEASR